MYAGTCGTVALGHSVTVALIRKQASKDGESANKALTKR